MSECIHKHVEHGFEPGAMASLTTTLPGTPPRRDPLSQKIIRSFASIQLQLIGQTTFSNARSLLGGCDGHQFSAWFLVTRNEPAQGLGLAIPSCSPRA